MESSTKSDESAKNSTPSNGDIKPANEEGASEPQSAQEAAIEISDESLEGLDPELQDLLISEPPTDIQIDPEALNVIIPKATFKELLNSSDFSSRLLTFLSVAFLIFSLVCIGLLVTVYKKNKAYRVQDPVKDSNEKSLLEPTHFQTLGHFHVFLKPDQQLNEGELRADLVAECTLQVTCDELKNKEILVRDAILPVLSNTTRNELVDPEEKQKIRRIITDILNGMISEGRVLHVHFSDIRIESGK